MIPAFVKTYLSHLATEGRAAPRILEVLDRSYKDIRPRDFLYRVDDHLWIHLFEENGRIRYHTLEPPLSDAEEPEVQKALLSIFEEIPGKPLPTEPTHFTDQLSQMLDAYLAKARLSEALQDTVSYHVRRRVRGAKELEPIIRDPWIEDINGLGTESIWVVHKVFGACHTTITFPDADALDAFLRELAEGMGRPVSEANPIVDGALADGSRINIVYGRSVSPMGSSFTIRKFSDAPIPITQLIAWGTLDETIGAYLWLCMEHGMSVFVSGETASGKTTTLNAMLPLVPPASKILSAEDTPEVRPPHPNWQQLVTREGSESARVDMGGLLKVGLRARPDRIIVGEIRGAEGAVAFQAMQTGYPTFATFHASSVSKLIQRFTSDPINVPAAFMPNLNVVLVQLAVHVGGRRLRRVVEVEEIEGYSRRLKSPITRQVFRWDPAHDAFDFGGRNNSYVLENLIAPKMGLEDPREVYAELERRAQLLKELVQGTRFDYHETTTYFQEVHA